MKVFRIEVTLQATAYVQADTEEAACVIMRKLDQETLELSRRDQQLSEELWISGRHYDDPALPAISLSPAMTLDVPADCDAEDVDD